jgi:plastocyanin
MGGDAQHLEGTLEEHGRVGRGRSRVTISVTPREPFRAARNLAMTVPPWIRDRLHRAAACRHRDLEWRGDCWRYNPREMSMIRTTMILALTLVLGLLGTGPVAADAPASRLEISVTRKGFAPDRLKVKKGEAVTLAFTRTTDATCAKSVIVQVGDGKKIEKELPLNKTVEIPVTFVKTGELTYACSMDMVRGIVLVE